MNSRPEIIRSDYKQTNFDNLQEDANDDDEPIDNQQQRQRYQTQQQQPHRIKITDKPIPLDNLTKDDAQVVELDNQARYFKLKQARDRLIHQKHELKPTPIIISPVKKRKPTKNNNDIDVEQEITSDSMFEPVSTKIFPSSKQREERIRLLKKMIHDAEKKSQARERQEHNNDEGDTQKDENVNVNDVKPTKLESLKEVTLSPPRDSSPVSHESRRFSSGSDHAPTFPSNLQSSTTPDEVSGTSNDESTKLSNDEDENDFSLKLDDAIDNFQHLKVDELEKETSFQNDKVKFPQHKLLFEDVDKRLAILEFQIGKIQSELLKLQQKTRKTNSMSFVQPVLVKRLKLRKVALFLFVICCFLAISFILAD